jgi:hypothetical protein
MSYIIFLLIPVVLWLAYRAKKLGYFDKKDNAAAGVVLDQGRTLAGTCTGRIDKPPFERRIANRDELLERKGINTSGMTEAQKNAATKGGGVDGGVYLDGAFAFQTNEAGNIIAGEIIVHGTRFKASGTFKADGSFAGSAHCSFSGKVSGTSVTGEILGGLGEEYHNGFLVGTFTAGGKL